MTHYIDKSALVAEIEKWINGWTERLKTNPSNPSFFEGGIELGKHILSFLDTLEVKEVDLEKEIKCILNQYYYFPEETIDTPTIMRITAEHFYELGFNARKEE